MVNKIGARWLQLVAGVIVLLFAGIIYAWSILKTPLITAFGWNNEQVGTNFTITLAVFCTGGFISGLITKKVPAAVRFLIAAALMFSSFFIVSRMQGNIIVLYLAYGLMGGLAIGFVYNTVICTVSAWFPDKRGFVSGLLLMGFGLNAIVIGRIAGSLVKPESLGWRPTFLGIAVVTAAVFVLAALIIRLPPAELILPAPKASGRPENASLETRDYTALEMLRRLSFWKLFIFFALLSSVGSASISFARDLIMDAGGWEDIAITMVGVIALANGFGRLISGWLFDAIGRRKTQFVTSAVAIVSPLAVVLALRTGALGIAVVGLVLCGISYGFAPTGVTAFTGAFYGEKHFSLNFGILNLHLILTAFAAKLAGVIKDATGGFTWMFVILAGFSVLGLLLNISIKKP